MLTVEDCNVLREASLKELALTYEADDDSPLMGALSYAVDAAVITLRNYEFLRDKAVHEK